MTEKAGREYVLEVENLTITYDTDKGPLDTVRDISLKIAPSELYGLVGESGSGKSTLALAIARYLASNGRIKSGSVLLAGHDLSGYSKAEMRKIWGAKISMVHQDPIGATNPSITIGEQIAEMAREHLKMSKREAKEKALEMLRKVRMPDPESVAKRYAHQLSGGMLQRVLIAIALVTNPQLLIMDEPTTALDVTTEAVILDLISDLLKESNSAILYITHNLGVVARVCHRIGVMYAGEIMEEGDVRQVLKDKLHPYTRGLLGSIPRVDSSKYQGPLTAIPGYIPRPDELPKGCIFAPRCYMASKECSLERPALTEAKPGHLTACRFPEAAAAEPKAAEKHTVFEPAAMKDSTLVLDAQNIMKSFGAPRSFSSLKNRQRSYIRAVDDVTLRVYAGLTVGVVGESGCGKTTFARCVAGLEQADAGELTLDGEKISYSADKRPSAMLKKIQMVFQNPTASLNPHHTIGQSIGRPLARLKNLSGDNIRKEAQRLLRAVNLPEHYLDRLPHELSGGEKQRVALARALAAEPELVICDEPISALDVSVQASLINLMVELQQSQGLSYLFITHDLAAVRHISDWISVVYLGRVWEEGLTDDVFMPPYHPYTEALLSAIPIPDPDIRQEQIRLRDSVPSALNVPSGCRFHTRCPRMLGEICQRQEPDWQSDNGVHRIRCHIPLDELREMQKDALGLVKIQNRQTLKEAE